MDLWWFLTYLIVVFLFLGGISWIVYVKKSYKYLLYYWEASGNLNKDGYSIGKLKKNKVKWNKKKTKWNLLFPLFKKTIIQPFDQDFIYPNNTVYSMKFGETYVPAKIKLEGDSPVVFPVPSFIKEWQDLELKENAVEFASESFWDKNKSFIMTVMVVAICAALCGVTVWYTYKFASGGRADMSALSNAIKGLQTYGGNVPT